MQIIIKHSPVTGELALHLRQLSQMIVCVTILGSIIKTNSNNPDVCLEIIK